VPPAAGVGCIRYVGRRGGAKNRRRAGFFRYPSRMADSLSLDEVRHVARLARLKLSEEELREYRRQLSTVLDHIARLQEVDVEGVEPMAHPGDLTNRLDDDRIEPSLDASRVMAMAPATESSFIAVPKVLPQGDAAP
jgi:aspartyl-tRNA(Asn)/glutamyl-tRNA(Gln) amidotransferase subunit C